MVGVGPDPLSAWVCGHGSPVRGSFFRCESANVGLWSWAMTEGGGGDRGGPWSPPKIRKKK
jgi:hypothetical protein